MTPAIQQNISAILLRLCQFRVMREFMQSTARNKKKTTKTIEHYLCNGHRHVCAVIWVLAFLLSLHDLISVQPEFWIDKILSTHVLIHCPQ